LIAQNRRVAKAHDHVFVFLFQHSQAFEHPARLIVLRHGLNPALNDPDLV
jgi:hypothetical protein